jgi:flagellar motor component MotA
LYSHLLVDPLGEMLDSRHHSTQEVHRIADVRMLAVLNGDDPRIEKSRVPYRTTPRPPRSLVHHL